MNLLLDTHILLWYLLGDEKLPNSAVEMIEDTDNSVSISIATLWEVQIKHLKHPAAFSIDSNRLAEFCDEAGFMFLPIEPEHISELSALVRKPDTPKHEDPFDRILLAQAESEGLMLLTSDSKIADYETEQVLLFQKKQHLQQSA